MIVGWAALVLLAVVLGLVYRRVARGRLVYETEGRAVTIAQQFTATSWPRVRAFTRRAPDLDPDALSEHPETEALHRDLLALRERFSVSKLRLYGASGLIVGSTDPDEVGRYTDDATVVEMAAGRWYGNGRPNAHSELIAADVLVTPETTLRDVDLVVTHVVIRDTSPSNLERDVGVLGIYQDVTPAARRIARTQALATGIVVAVAMVALVVVWPRPPSLEASGSQSA